MIGLKYIPAERRPLKRNSAFTISSPDSNGMSPQTMSKSKIPMDQTVADLP